MLRRAAVAGCLQELTTELNTTVTIPPSVNASQQHYVHGQRPWPAPSLLG